MNMTISEFVETVNRQQIEDWQPGENFVGKKIAYFEPADGNTFCMAFTDGTFYKLENVYYEEDDVWVLQQADCTFEDICDVDTGELTPFGKAVDADEDWCKELVKKYKKKRQ